MEQTDGVQKRLVLLRKLRAERAALYKDAPETFGELLKILIEHNGWPDYNDVKKLERFGILLQIIAKLARYIQCGNVDSLNDMAVYSMMLAEIDESIFQQEEQK